MNFAEHIKEGIQNKDWSRIIEGYKLLTGEDLSEDSTPADSSVPASNPVEGDGFLAEIRSGEQKPADDDDDFSGRVARKEPMNLQRDQGWVDDRTIATAEFVSQNPSLGVTQPVERGRRNTGEQIRAECMICHKTEEVSPVLVSNPQTYKCNDCIPSRR